MNNKLIMPLLAMFAVACGTEEQPSGERPIVDGQVTETPDGTSTQQDGGACETTCPQGPAGQQGPVGPAGANGNSCSVANGNGPDEFVVMCTDGTFAAVHNGTPGAPGAAGAIGPAGPAGASIVGPVGPAGPKGDTGSISASNVYRKVVGGEVLAAPGVPWVSQSAFCDPGDIVLGGGCSQSTTTAAIYSSAAGDGADNTQGWGCRFAGQGYRLAQVICLDVTP